MIYKNKHFVSCTWVWILSVTILVGACSTAYAESVKIKKNETGLYRDIFDDNVYYELTSYLRFDRLYEKITGNKKRAMNVNIYDEVPDGNLFVNRHAKSPLSLEQLAAGSSETNGPDLSGPLTVIKGKFEGLNPGFFVRDSKGDTYLLKFDFIDSFEMRTGAEVVASRIFHAIGYNVPQYSIISFPVDKLVPEPGAKIVDDTGFRKDLTLEKLEEYLLFLPQDASGNYRASASKIIDGENIGYMPFYGRRRDDPHDKIDHEDLREVRALGIFGSWVNNYDIRNSNTISVIVDGRVKNYIIDFGSSLGGGLAVPMFTFEHMMDYTDAAKAFLAFGFWEKPWQKRWREQGAQVNHSQAVGDFDNRYFKPNKYEIQLPYYAFKDATRADAFWAAKMIMSFSDEEIRAMVREGKYSESEDTKYIGDVLIERRDIIGRYWFDQASPLDQFDIQGGALVFEDLGVKYGFHEAANTVYQVKIKGSKTIKVQGTSIDLSNHLQQSGSLDVVIRCIRSGKSYPYVRVRIRDGRIAEIIHQD